MAARAGGGGGYGDPRWPEDYDLFLRADAAELSEVSVAHEAFVTAMSCPEGWNIQSVSGDPDSAEGVLG